MPQDQSKTPKPKPLPAGKTLQSYPLAPVDGFVLSRIDGTLTVRDLTTLTGLDEATVDASIEKLASLGLVNLGSRPPPPRSMPPPAGAESAPRSASIPVRPVTEVSDVLATGAPKPKPALYDPAELDEDVELDRNHRRKILDAYYRLGELNLYEVLAVERSADKKSIKRAYYELASVHHPDRFFRKRLGSFKQKMEAVFSRVTEAHDTLTDKEKRAEYDAYLGAQNQAKSIEARMARPTTSPGMDRSDAPPAAPEIAPPPPPPAERTSGIHLSEQARRDALARRLLGGRASPPPPPQRELSTPPPAADPGALRRHYEQRIALVREHMMKEHLTAAENAVAASDWVVATNAYRLALQVSPDDAELKRKAETAQAKANLVLAEAYRKQAVYEEKSGKTEDAARSWQRVTKLQPDAAEAHAHAASCMLKAGVELRTAATLAQRAVTLEPTDVKHRITLAEIYLAGGLTLNARRELEAAARMAPDDANIEALMKRAGKG